LRRDRIQQRLTELKNRYDARIVEKWGKTALENQFSRIASVAEDMAKPDLTNAVRCYENIARMNGLMRDFGATNSLTINVSAWSPAQQQAIAALATELIQRGLCPVYGQSAPLPMSTVVQPMTISDNGSRVTPHNAGIDSQVIDVNALTQPRSDNDSSVTLGDGQDGESATPAIPPSRGVDDTITGHPPVGHFESGLVDKPLCDKELSIKER
jgi:hypothetical protein